MDSPLRIAMWSGPRNLSTALMRSFGNRSDVVRVHDEPLYAAYLAQTGKQHPMRDAVLASQSTDWAVVCHGLVHDPADGVVYQKHMTHHVLAHYGWAWAESLCNCFLIRAPEKVAASFDRLWPDAQPEDLGFAQQAALFDHLCERRGTPPPVIDAADLAADPEDCLRRLCASIGIDFQDRMLSWPPGLRPSDGVWASHWYAAVAKSTGFTTPETEAEHLVGRARKLADAIRPHYERMRRHVLQRPPL